MLHCVVSYIDKSKETRYFNCIQEILLTRVGMQETTYAWSLFSLIKKECFVQREPGFWLWRNCKAFFE